MKRIQSSVQTFGRLSAAILFVCFIVVVSIQSASSSDLRITMLLDGIVTEETIVKQSQVIIAESGGNRIIYDCIAADYTYISDTNELYWRGSIDQITGQLRDQVAPMIATLEHQFGDALYVTLRTTHLGQDELLGYVTESYLIEESGDGESWGEREQLWLSSDLEDDIREVSPSCHNVGEPIARLQVALISLVYGPREDDLKRYYTLFDGAFPMKVRVNTIGGWYEREVIDVSRESIDDELFELPDHYKETASVIDVIG